MSQGNKEEQKKPESKSDTKNDDNVGNGAKQLCEDEGEIITEASTDETASSTAALSRPDMNPPTESEDPITAASRQLSIDGPKPTSAEKIFSLLLLNNSLYTLAALLPVDVCGWGQEWGELHQTVGEQVLPALLEVSACTALQSVTIRLAYIVAAQYMSRISPQVCLLPCPPPFFFILSLILRLHAGC